MKFLVDENVKLRLAKLLTASGHDVLLAPKGSSDNEIGKIAQKQKRIILTHDNDFAAPGRFPAKDYAGIILIKVFPPTFVKMSASLQNLLCAFTAARNYNGKLIFLISENLFWVE
jgi:hypothetical protein